MSSEDENHEPSWLDTGNDEVHRKEVEPLLFGTGNLALTDPDDSDGDDENPFASTDDVSDVGKSKSSKPKNKKGYGSTEGSTSKPPDHGSLWTLPTAATSLLGKSDDSKPAFFDDKTDASKEDDDNGKDDVIDEITFHEKTGRPHKPSRHWIVRVFFTIQTFGIITNLALLVSQILPIVFVPVSSVDMSYVALKIYLCAFSIIFLIVEFDHPSIPFLRKASFLKTFASRGFLYTFLGLVCFDEADSEAAFEALEEQNSDFAAHFEVSWFAVFNVIAAWSLIGLGALYFLMGIVCLQKIRNRYVYDDRQKWKAHREA
eukprot:CAMPEP_0197180878 /NCGR_PEP_ID=MMETSP1423-20130617/5327_1 /TAXON_ID=476441 /ORGANISM="Pseudo-nitzschia heimii, Strain UNC1101" /LENGTH=315 /DNA_ID=CAMNT_0042631013 /DNA_START=76 /DNA_END=1020 /DNA_ORIENTATION=-